MPIYEDQMKYEDMVKAMKTHRCAECGGVLNVAWSAKMNCYILRCADLSHSTITTHRELSPEEIEGRKVFKGGRIYMETTALQKLEPSQMMERVNQARFPKDLTIQERQLIAKVSIEYGLDPLFGELMIYQGRPYVTIDARRRKAQETGQLDGINSRPATKKEREAREVPDGDYLYVAEVWVKESGHPFEGWGKVRADETKGDPHLPIVKDPGAQAEKRAEAQALRRAFHLPLPSAEEIVEGEFKELPEQKPALQSKTKPPKEETRPTAPPQVGTITSAQRNKIWGDATKMGYKDDEVHAIIKAKWGVESVNDLDIKQASDLIGMIDRGEGLPARNKEGLPEDDKDLWPEGEKQ